MFFTVRLNNFLMYCGVPSPSKIKGVFSVGVEAKFLSEWSWVKQSASTASLSYTHLHNNSEDAKSQNTNFLFAAHWNTDGGGGGKAQGTFNIMSLHTGRLCIIFHLFLCVGSKRPVQRRKGRGSGRGDALFGRDGRSPGKASGSFQVLLSRERLRQRGHVLVRTKGFVFPRQ